MDLKELNQAILAERLSPSLQSIPADYYIRIHAELEDARKKVTEPEGGEYYHHFKAAATDYKRVRLQKVIDYATRQGFGRTPYTKEYNHMLQCEKVLAQEITAAIKAWSGWV